MDSQSLSRPSYDSSSPKTEFDDTRLLPSLFKKEGISSKAMSSHTQLHQLVVCIASIIILGCIGLAIKLWRTFNWLSFRRSSNKMDETRHLFRLRGRPPRKPPHKTTVHERMPPCQTRAIWILIFAIALIPFAIRSIRLGDNFGMQQNPPIVPVETQEQHILSDHDSHATEQPLDAPASANNSHAPEQPLDAPASAN